MHLPWRRHCSVSICLSVCLATLLIVILPTLVRHMHVSGLSLIVSRVLQWCKSFTASITLYYYYIILYYIILHYNILYFTELLLHCRCYCCLLPTVTTDCHCTLHCVIASSAVPASAMGQFVTRWQFVTDCYTCIHLCCLETLTRSPLDFVISINWLFDVVAFMDLNLYWIKGALALFVLVSGYVC